MQRHIITAAEMTADRDLHPHQWHQLGLRRLARALTLSRPVQDTASSPQWELDVATIADAIAVENPGFDRKRFHKMCVGPLS
jgi:hypothetical protein